MKIKSRNQLKQYKRAATISTAIMNQLHSAIRVGVSPIELDQLAGELCEQHGVEPAFKGVKHNNLVYQHNSCISVNDEILHGIPNQTPLKIGDLVKVDFGIIYQGLYTDHCFTVGVKKVNQTGQKLLEVGREAVLNAVKLAQPENHTQDLGHVMHATAQEAGFETLKEYVGHGIGQSLHEEPQIPAFGNPGKGSKLKKNMIVCVECQVVPGSDKIYVDQSGWTVKTKDGNKGVMFEYMVRVDENPEILTQTQDWPLVV
jgi:methionyl aminopeptidase